MFNKAISEINWINWTSNGPVTKLILIKTVCSKQSSRFIEISQGKTGQATRR